MQNRDVVVVRLDPEAVWRATTLQHSFTGNARERGMPNDRARWGLFTEDESMMLEANQCPFCFADLPDDWDWS